MIKISKELEIGEVIYNNDMQMVVIDCKNREDIGACSYDRSYKLCLLEELKDGLFTPEDFEKLGHRMDVRGTSFPDIKRVKDVALFEITKVTSYRIRQKKAKTITIYE
jgi:hypothetical protein